MTVAADEKTWNCWSERQTQQLGWRHRESRAHGVGLGAPTWREGAYHQKIGSECSHQVFHTSYFEAEGTHEDNLSFVRVDYCRKFRGHDLSVSSRGNGIKLQRNEKRKE
jgi:hypothetical protein